MFKKYCECKNWMDCPYCMTEDVDGGLVPLRYCNGGPNICVFEKIENREDEENNG